MLRLGCIVSVCLLLCDFVVWQALLGFVVVLYDVCNSFNFDVVIDYYYFVFSLDFG